MPRKNPTWTRSCKLKNIQKLGGSCKGGWRDLPWSCAKLKHTHVCVQQGGGP